MCVVCVCVWRGGWPLCSVPCCTCLSGRWTNTPRAGSQAAEHCEVTGVAILPSDRSLLLLPLLFSTNIPSAARSCSQFLLYFSFASLSYFPCLRFYLASSWYSSFLTTNSLRSGNRRADPTASRLCAGCYSSRIGVFALWWLLGQTQ